MDSNFLSKLSLHLRTRMTDLRASTEERYQLAVSSIVVISALLDMYSSRLEQFSEVIGAIVTEGTMIQMKLN